MVTNDCKKQLLLIRGDTWLQTEGVVAQMVNELRTRLTSGGLRAVRAAQRLRQVLLPRVLDGGLEDLPAVQVLHRPEVVPQVVDGLDVVLLLRRKDGVKRIELQSEETGSGALAYS